MEREKEEAREKERKGQSLPPPLLFPPTLLFPQLTPAALPAPPPPRRIHRVAAEDLLMALFRLRPASCRLVASSNEGEGRPFCW